MVSPGRQQQPAAALPTPGQKSGSKHVGCWSELISAPGLVRVVVVASLWRLLLLLVQLLLLLLVQVHADELLAARAEGDGDGRVEAAEAGVLEAGGDRRPRPPRPAPQPQAAARRAGGHGAHRGAGGGVRGVACVRRAPAQRAPDERPLLGVPVAGLAADVGAAPHVVIAHVAELVVMVRVRGVLEARVHGVYLHVDVAQRRHGPEVLAAGVRGGQLQVAHGDDGDLLPVGERGAVDGGRVAGRAEHHRLLQLALRVQEVV